VIQLADQRHNADPRFVEYYTEASTSPATLARFRKLMDALLKLRRSIGSACDRLDVIDVGCGAGTQALIWAEQGHRVKGVDVSAPLVEVARQRSTSSGKSAQFEVGDAQNLPAAGASADVVLLSELLEHIAPWQAVLDEATRVLRPGGLLYVSTTNKLCPIQEEFDLPGYSWYPNALKRRCEQMAVTTHPHWVQHASYPAVNWFSFYQLRDWLRERNCDALDRFDMVARTSVGARAQIARMTSTLAPLRLLGQVLTPYTVVVAHKH
jgi:2-polyprenyl-6-hydroxyphenyl methylase/3-demethylubiquinone-9 3-methyltransferase